MPTHLVGGGLAVGNDLVQVKLEPVRAGVGDLRRMAHPPAGVTPLRLPMTGTDSMSLASRTWRR